MPQPLRVLHIGDLHLGVELYGRPDPERGYGTRVGDFLDALDQALSHADQADLILFPGDIYKNCDPTPTIQREFAGRIRKAAQQAPVVIIPGNHDLPNAYARASSVDIFEVLEVPSVHVLRKPGVYPVQTRRGQVLIAALPFLPKSRLVTLDEARSCTIPEVIKLMETKLNTQVEELAGEVRAERAKRSPETLAILTAHYTVRGAVFGGYGAGASLAPEVQLDLQPLRSSEWDYVALAHIHKHQSVPENDYLNSQPPVVYPGSIERIDFGEEKEAKVVVMATLHERNHAEWRPIHLNPRPFKTIRMQVDSADPIGSARAQLENWKAGIEGAIIRIYYTLEGGLPNLPERELRSCLEGAAYVAGIRRDVENQGSRIRVGQMTTQLSPLEALDVYLKTQEHLKGRREDLLERGRLLIDHVLGESEELPPDPLGGVAP